MDSPLFAPAVQRFEKMFSDMDTALAQGPWLAGQEFSLADIAYSPCMVRLEHLGFGERIAQHPRVLGRMQRLFATPGHRTGVEQWFNPRHLEIFSRESPAARERIRLLTSR